MDPTQAARELTPHVRRLRALARWIGEALPLTHFLRIVRGIVLKGAPIESLWVEVAAILAFLAVAMLVAIARFTKRLG